MPRIAFEDLRDFGTALFVRKGVREADARFMADAAVTTQAGGIPSHGVRLFVRLDRNPDGVDDPGRRPVVHSSRGGTAVIDCEGCYGPLGVRLAQRLGVRKARTHGLAMVAVRNGSWLGGLGAFVLPLVREGFLVQAWAQYGSCHDSAPPGGLDARLSTNPVCLGFPGSQGPVLADFSTTIISMGRAMRLAEQGARTEAPCFLDRDGALTDDPRVLSSGGAMLPMGGDQNGYKGFAFSLWAEALAAMAGGRANHPDSPARQYFNLLLVHPDFFGQEACYMRELKQLEGWIKSSRRREGHSVIRFPGERFLESLAFSRARGVQVEGPLLDALQTLAEKYGIPRLETVAVAD